MQANIKTKVLKGSHESLRQRWQTLIDEYEGNYKGSGLSFCLKNDLKSRSFYYWLQRLSSKAKQINSQTGFAKIILSTEAVKPPKESVKIVFPNGLAVLLSVDLESLPRVLEACRKCG